jgi:hypothetical protein
MLLSDEEQEYMPRVQWESMRRLPWTLWRRYGDYISRITIKGTPKVNGTSCNE